MTTDWQTGVQPPIAQSKGGRGCLFYGCLTVAVIVVLSVIVLFFAIKAFVMKISDEKPLLLEEMQVTQEESEQVLSKVRAFREKMEGQQATAGETLTLTERDLNALLYASKDLDPFRNALRVHLRGSTIGIDYSQSLENIRFAGRYMNMRAVTEASVERGNLHVVIKELKLADNSIVQGMPSSAARGTDIGPQLMSTYPQIGRIISRIERAEVKDSKLHVELKK